jgi:Diguanylate cyclase, GGDEF domain
LLLPASKLARALTVAESLRLQVRSHPLELGGLSVPLSVSIGVAEWAGPSEDLSRLLARADDAPYRAKRLARDRVEAALQGAAEPLPQPVCGFFDRAPGSWRCSHSENSAYHSRELRGLSTQWFSSGNHSSRASTLRALSVL